MPRARVPASGRWTDSVGADGTSAPSGRAAWSRPGTEPASGTGEIYTRSGAAGAPPALTGRPPRAIHGDQRELHGNDRRVPRERRRAAREGGQREQEAARG